MPRILATCRTTGARVSTGRRTSDVDLETLETELYFRCPSCAQVHGWGRGDALVEHSLASLRPVA
jgi:hypothetical protein